VSDQREAIRLVVEGFGDQQAGGEIVATAMVVAALGFAGQAETWPVFHTWMIARARRPMVRAALRDLTREMFLEVATSIAANSQTD
jgi:N-glycosylase/DNA lyase